MSLFRVLHRTRGWVWAGPNTVLGVVAGVAMICLGGKMRCVRGAIEFSGGLAGRTAARLPPRFRFTAMTLGHVILGLSEADLAAARDHEHVHVRQYEEWGPFFLPAYAASSVWQLLCGRRAYRDNFFEREAYALERPRLSAEPLRRLDTAARRS